MSDQFPTGWINKPEDVAAYIAERAFAGAPCAIVDARPDLKGFWGRLVQSGIFHVMLFQAEYALLGEYLPADLQHRGTCVGRGTYRAVQTSYWDAIRERRISGKPEKIAYEPIYAGSRVAIGRGQLGNDDGSCGVWAAQWVHDFGVIARGRYSGIDLTRDREDLAVDWGYRQGVPDEIKFASASHKCDVYNVSDANDLADVTAARYASAICSSHKQASRRDENGECSYECPTAHCEAIVGVYMRPTWDGRPETIYGHTGFVDQQSWGNVPSGNDVLRVYRDAIKLRQGAYGTTIHDIRQRLPTGETWAFSLRDGFRGDTLSEMV